MWTSQIVSESSLRTATDKAEEGSKDGLKSHLMASNLKIFPWGVKNPPKLLCVFTRSRTQPHQFNFASAGPVAARYWWVSVGFIYRSVTIRPSTIFTVVSRNDASLVPRPLPDFLHGCEIKSGSGLGTRLEWRTVSGPGHSVVNLMVGWAWLISSTKLVRLSSPWFQRVNMSSMYCHHIAGSFLAQASSCCSSLLGILVFSDETSRVTRSVPSGMLFKDCSLVMKLVVSLMKEGRFSTSGRGW